MNDLPHRLSILQKGSVWNRWFVFQNMNFPSLFLCHLHVHKIYIFHFLSIKKSPHLEGGWASVGVNYLATADPTFTLHLYFFNLSFIKKCDSVASFFSSGDACLALKPKPQPLMWGFFFLVLVIQCYFFAPGARKAWNL